MTVFKMLYIKGLDVLGTGEFSFSSNEWLSIC